MPPPPSERRWIVLVDAGAPPKPALGAPCNGCGICCLAEPCPLGMLLSLRRRGRCVALDWDPRASRYRCGAVVRPGAVLRARLPRGWSWAAQALAPLLRWMAPRWIAAGTGCDCQLDAGAPTIDTAALPRPGAPPGTPANPGEGEHPHGR